MNRSRSGDRQPPPRGGGPDLGKEIVKAEHYPTLGKCMEILREGMRIMVAAENRATGVRSAVLPSYEVEGSQKCPSSPEFDEVRNLRACRLFEADLKRPQTLRTPQMHALTRLLNVGRYRAKGYPPPMEWAGRERLTKYAATGPDQPRRDGAEFAIWANSLQPVAVVPRTAENTVPKIDSEGVGGVAAIPAEHATKNCGCLELVVNNPLEFTLYSTWCIPKECKNELENRWFRKQGPSDVRRYINSSMSFFSYLSEIGTVYQRLQQRTPLSSISRGVARAYTPPAAKLDLGKKPGVLRAVMSAMSRPEFLSKIPRFNEDSGPDDSEDLCRFPPAELQSRCSDVRVRGPTTVDIILNNSVFAAPFYGDILCSYCCQMITCRDIADVIGHLVNRHKKLARSWFSCPSCLSCTITDWAGFSAHWVKYHASSLALIVVLEEANVAARLSLGLALHTWIATCKLMRIWPMDSVDSEVELPLMRSAAGGYAEKEKYTPEQLAAAIKEDQVEQLPARLADEFRKSEVERQQAKQREAEKRNRETAAMDMPPPDSWSTVVSRKSRQIHSSSTMDPGEGHSRWGEPCRKKLAAKATIGPTEPLFQRGEKEKTSREESARMYSSQVHVQVQRGEKEKDASGGGMAGVSGQHRRGEVERGYDPNFPGYTSQLMSGSSTPYTPETERVSPPPRQQPAQPRQLDLSALVATALETAMGPPVGCDEDVLFDEAVRTPCPPGTEGEDVEMRSPGAMDDLEAAKRYLDEDEEDIL